MNSCPVGSQEVYEEGRRCQHGNCQETACEHVVLWPGEEPTYLCDGHFRIWHATILLHEIIHCYDPSFSVTVDNNGVQMGTRIRPSWIESV